MALKLVIQFSKKMPGPTDYSSVQASCSIDAEISTGQDLVAESGRLYAQAEAAVDRQLGLAQTPSSPRGTVSLATSSASKPYSRPSRCQPTGITPAQRLLIDQLLRDTKTDPAAVLQHFGIASLDYLSCKQASFLIDDLKARA